MREILYRGQIRRKGEKVQMPNGKPLPSRWVYGGIFAPHTYEKGFAVIYGNEGERDEPITGTKLEKYPVYRDTVGQYTGMQDKNGVKIFEGDIVQFEDEKPGQYEYHDDTFMNIGAVEYANGCFVFTNRVAVEMDDLIYENTAECIIVGNIYDNPELLEGYER